MGPSLASRARGAGTTRRTETPERGEKRSKEAGASRAQQESIIFFGQSRIQSQLRSILTRFFSQPQSQSKPRSQTIAITLSIQQRRAMVPEQAA
jgi:hypothetical protein